MDPQKPATSTWRGDITGGIMASVLSVPICMGYAAIAFAPLGREYLPIGVASLFVALAISNLVPPLFRGTTIMINGTYALTAVMIASVLSTILDLLPKVETWSERAELALVLLFFTVFVSGLMQVVSGFLKIGGLAKYVPLPVVAGLRNGAAVLVVVKQIRPMLGLDAAAAAGDWGQLLADARVLTLVVGVLTFAAIVQGPRWVRRAPPVLLGIVVGTLAYYALVLLGGSPRLGPVIGEIPSSLPRPDYAVGILRLFQDDKVHGLMLRLLPLAAGIAVASNLNTLIAAVSADSLTQQRSKMNRELVGQGVGNMVAGLFGGISNNGTVATTLASYASGGRTRLAAYVCGAFSVVILLVLGPYVSYVPQVVLAGALVYMAIRLVEPWSITLVRDFLGRETRTREVSWNLAIVLSVVVIVLYWGAMQAVGAGLIISVLYFVLRMTKENIRRQFSGERIHSTVQRVDFEVGALETHGGAIRVLELEGALFFGTTDRLLTYIDGLLNLGVGVIILDFSRVSEIDSTAANMLLQAAATCQQRGVCLLLSALEARAEVARFVRTTALVEESGERRAFATMDDALAWAEDRLLDQHLGPGRYDREVALEQVAVLGELSPEQLAGLAPYLSREEYADGETLFHQGDPGDAMYFLVRGRASVLVRIGGDAYRRVGMLCLGTVFGEMALLDGKPRSASIQAVGPVTCYRMSAGRLAELNAGSPEIAYGLFRGLTIELSRRLRLSNQAVTELRA